MFEPITLAKVRKATTVKVPAGGWIILGSPNQSLSEHIAKRAKLVKDGTTNDDYEKIIIGRLQSTHSNAVFVTTAEQKARDAAQESFTKDAVAANDDAKAREKALKDAADKTAQDEHAKRLAQINAENDAIRNGRPVPKEEPITETEKE